MGKSQQSTTVTESWLRRVAIVVSNLPTSVASRLLQGVDPETLSRIQRACKTLCGIEPEERDAVLREFREQMFVSGVGAATAGLSGQERAEYQDKFDITGSSDSASSDSADLLNSQVASVVSQWELPRSFHSDARNESPFAFLDDVDDEIVVRLLSREHAQTIALVFASITPKQAARILPRLDVDTQSETVRRIGRLDDVPAATAAEVAAHLQQRVAELEHQWNNPAHQTLKAIIDAMPREHDGPPERGDEFGNPAPATDVQQSVSVDQTAANREPDSSAESLSTDDVHLHLMQLPPRALCKALGQVKTREALLALCGLPNEVAETALSMLPRSRAKEVRRGMAKLSSIRLREIDEAKEAVALASLQFNDHRHASRPVAA